MNILSIKVYIPPRAAIVAGKTLFGTVAMDVTEEMLHLLTEDLRLELALVLEGEPVLGTLETDPAIIEPCLEYIKPVLEARALARKTAVETKKVLEARAVQETLVSSKNEAAKDRARDKALRDWVGAHGDEEQKARMSEGFFKEEEILGDICDDLLDAPGFQEYEPLRRGDACECACAREVVFAINTPKYMDAAQYASLTAVREHAPAGATVIPVEHKASCSACKCVPIARISARISLPWNGWLLVREFLI